MRPVQFERLLPALLGLYLVATGVHAKTQEELQDQLVDSVRKANQEADEAAERFKANDVTGGCIDLRAATMDTADGLDLTSQLSAMIRQEAMQTARTRDRMLHDLSGMSATLTAQKQDMDAQFGSHCG